MFDWLNAKVAAVKVKAGNTFVFKLSTIYIQAVKSAGSGVIPLTRLV